jgi:hypothetical protein
MLNKVFDFNHILQSSRGLAATETALCPCLVEWPVRRPLREGESLVA